MNKLKTACESSNDGIGAKAARIYETIQEQAPGLTTMLQKQRYTVEGKRATEADTPVLERQPFIDANAARNPMITHDFQVLGGEETFVDTQDGETTTWTVPSAETIADEINVKTLQGLEVGAER